MDKEGYRRQIRLSPAWNKNEDNKEKTSDVPMIPIYDQQR